MTRKALAIAPSRNLEQDIAAAQILKAQLVDIFGNETDVGLIKDMIEGETGLFEAIDGVLAQIGMDAAAIEGLASFKKTIDARKSRLENRVETLRSILLNAMDVLGEKKFERPIATLTVKAVAPSLTIIDEAAIPTGYWKPQDPTLDKKALTDALKLNRDTLAQKLAELEGADMPEPDKLTARDRLLAAFPAIPGAELSNGGATVQIRFS